MKLKLIAAACAAMGSGAVMAAPLPTNTGAPAGLVTYYISGASAQAAAVAASLPTASFFATPTDVVKISGGSTTDARYGMSNPAVTGGTSVPLLIIYRNSNGSGSGVRQLQGATLADIAAIPNTDNTNLVNLAGTCGAVAGSAGSYTASCTAGFQARVPTVALSDVAPTQLPGVFPSGTGYTALADLVASKNALQGFGVAANPKLYGALQKANVAEGLLPATCAPTGTAPNYVPVAGADCQPTIRKNDYASLISAEGSIKGADTLLGDSLDTTEVTVCRRTDLSGTQATSNMFFLNNVCGNAGFGGVYNPLGAADSAPGQIVYVENNNSAAVAACLNNTAAYRLGVISLENIDTTQTYKFVKIDGASPNYTYNGTTVVADPKNRQNFAKGQYAYAMEMFSAIKPTATPAEVAFASALNAKLGDSTLSDLAGIAYLDNQGGWTVNNTSNKFARVSRQGNNCAPLNP